MKIGKPEAMPDPTARFQGRGFAFIRKTSFIPLGTGCAGATLCFVSLSFSEYLFIYKILFLTRRIIGYVPVYAI